MVIVSKKATGATGLYRELYAPINVMPAWGGGGEAGHRVGI